MTETFFSLNEIQFQKILAAQHGWWPVASVFVSAFLAMMVGIGAERLRARFERRKMTRERQEHEVQQINAVKGLSLCVRGHKMLLSRGMFVIERITNMMVTGDADERLSPLLDRVPAALCR
jgi:hypothetical protein